MKSLSIKTQKILALLPIINTIGIFVFLYQCAVLKIDKKTFAKTLLLIFPIVIIFGFGMTVIDSLFGASSVLYKVLSILSLSGFCFLDNYSQPKSFFGGLMMSQVQYDFKFNSMFFAEKTFLS